MLMALKCVHMREVLHGAFSANKLTDEEIEKKIT
jgi:hypothetical protein